MKLSSFVQQDWATTGYPDESSKHKSTGKDRSKSKKAKKNTTNNDKPESESLQKGPDVAEIVPVNKI